MGGKSGREIEVRAESKSSVPWEGGSQTIRRSLACRSSFGLPSPPTPKPQTPTLSPPPSNPPPSTPTVNCPKPWQAPKLGRGARPAQRVPQDLPRRLQRQWLQRDLLLLHCLQVRLRLGALGYEPPDPGPCPPRPARGCGVRPGAEAVGRRWVGGEGLLHRIKSEV